MQKLYEYERVGLDYYTDQVESRPKDKRVIFGYQEENKEIGTILSSEDHNPYKAL